MSLPLRSPWRNVASPGLYLVGLCVGCTSTRPDGGAAPPVNGGSGASLSDTPATGGHSAEVGGLPGTAGAVGQEPPPVLPPTNGGAGQGMVGSAGGMVAGVGSGGVSVGAGGTSTGSGGALVGAGGTSAGGSAGIGGNAGANTSTRVPMFQKTRCIDPAQVTAGTEINFPCDGVEIWVALPSQCLTRTCGLIFDIHGGAMTDHATMEQATNMIPLGNQADFIVVHPHQPSGVWNVATDKDVVFGFMQQVIQAFDVDLKRVHSTGYSQGGQISWALACEHADVVASVAPAEEINRVSDCWTTSKLPVREVPVLFAFGRQDSIGGGIAAAQMQASSFVAAYQMMGPDTLVGTEASKYWRQRWTSKSGNVLEFITQNYTSTGLLGVIAGHCLPLSTGTTFVNCSPPVDYDWGKEAVLFFQAHPMP